MLFCCTALSSSHVPVCVQEIGNMAFMVWTGILADTTNSLGIRFLCFSVSFCLSCQIFNSSIAVLGIPKHLHEPNSLPFQGLEPNEEPMKDINSDTGLQIDICRFTRRIGTSWGSPLICRWRNRGEVKNVKSGLTLMSC
jgi:hypothetical protein